MAGGKAPTPWAHKLGQDVLLMSYFTYPKGSKLGQFLAFLSLSPMALIFGLLGAFFTSQDVWYITLCCMLLTSTLINEIVKRIIKEPRPKGTLNHKIIKFHLEATFTLYNDVIFVFKNQKNVRRN